MADKYPPKVVTLDDIESFLPWAHVEVVQVDPYDNESQGELVIYTGLRHVTGEHADTPLAFIDGMTDQPRSLDVVTEVL